MPPSKLSLVSTPINNREKPMRPIIANSGPIDSHTAKPMRREGLLSTGSWNTSGTGSIRRLLRESPAAELSCDMG